MSAETVFTKDMRTYRIIDTETGEVYRTEKVRDDERSQREWKGWLLRTRSAYKRRTGHGLRVERTATAEDYADIQRAAQAAAGIQPVEPW